MKNKINSLMVYDHDGSFMSGKRPSSKQKKGSVGQTSVSLAAGVGGKSSSFSSRGKRMPDLGKMDGNMVALQLLNRPGAEEGQAQQQKYVTSLLHAD